MVPIASLHHRSLVCAAAIVVCSASGLSLAQEAGRLGNDLTPTGAEKAGSASGIPAWEAPGPTGAGWTHGKLRGDFFKYKSDKPLYRIDASNVDKYADKLNPGQVELLKNLNGYRMDVYPSRRTCTVPDLVAENTRKNLTFAKMNPDGISLADAYVPGVPFALPKTGAEVMWNSKMRYHGEGVELRDLITTVSPRKGSSDWIKVVADSWYHFPWGKLKPGQTFSKFEGTEALGYAVYKAPAALAGQAVMFMNYSGKQQEAHYYFPGQRRVRRLPTYAYDAPQIGFENQYTMDEPYVFAGSLDRFDWKLVGKKEMIVPYNSFGMFDFTAKFDDAMLRDYVNPANRRYELHRVWVVEATVKSGMRHLDPKRIFYVDEDSWNLVAAVDYDAQGKIWKTREGHVIPLYELGGACESIAFLQYNVTEGRYVMDGAPIASGKDLLYFADGAGKPNMRADYYTSENLRAMSER
jgi:hypothetical protein